MSYEPKQWGTYDWDDELSTSENLQAADRVNALIKVSDLQRIENGIRDIEIPEPIPGIDGKDGVDGKDGKDGEPGTNGVDGIDGKDGEPGADGKDGTNGIDGVDGKDGEPGTDGTNGIDGKDGVDGTNGKDGKDGLNGDLVMSGIAIGTANLNTIIVPGFYHQFVLNNVTADNNYPITRWACNVWVVGTSGGTSRVRQYLTISNGRMFIRGTSDGGSTWGAWVEQATIPQVEATMKSYGARYENRVTITSENWADTTTPITLARTGDSVELTGAVRLLTADLTTGSLRRLVTKIPPNFVPGGSGIRYATLMSAGRTYLLSVSGASADIAISRQDVAAVGDILVLSMSWDCDPKPTSNYGLYYGNLLEGVEYAINSSAGSRPSLASIAIHGGETEKGTSELAQELRDRTGASYYELESLFDPMRGSSAFDHVHADSNGFDEPKAMAIVTPANRCVSFHGAADNNYGTTGAASFVGGSDVELRQKISDNLRAAGFVTMDNPAEFPNLAGTSPRNICNQTTIGAGVQIELTSTLRRSLFPNNDASRENRKSGQRTSVFYDYISAVESACKSVMGF